MFDLFNTVFHIVSFASLHYLVVINKVDTIILPGTVKFSMTPRRKRHLRENLLKIENRCLKIINIHKNKDFTRRQLQIHNLVTQLHYQYMLSYFQTTNSLVPITDINSPSRLYPYHRLGEFMSVIGTREFVVLKYDSIRIRLQT